MHREYENDIPKASGTAAGSPRVSPPHREATSSAVSRAREAVGRGVEKLLRHAEANGIVADQWDELKTLLEALPLATATFALAARRLGNARRYIESGEFGAAKFELRMMLRGLV